MLELRGVTKRFGHFTAVKSIDLSVQAGEFITLLGPSGCGKTTLLRLLAGFETPDEGTILLDGEDVSRVPPYRRCVNQVFQGYALFPHLTVRENVGFGLRMQKVPPAEAAKRISEALDIVSLQEQADIVCRPKVLLLDEPLSALDAKLRHAMQLELKHLQRRLGITFVFVTHDQDEALTMSDRIAVINQGKIEQLGTTTEIYHRPRTPFAADFIGQANLLSSTIVYRNGTTARIRLETGLELVVATADLPAAATKALVSVRPEKIHIGRVPAEAENVFQARIAEEIFQGATDRLQLVTDQGTNLHALVANESATQEAFHEGDRVYCSLHLDDIIVVHTA
jgi:spermidine/putrescine transport system ATP-binding protein